MAAARPLPSCERLHELFSLDERTALLVRKAAPGMLPRIAKRFAGKPAGHVNALGYVQVLIDGRSYLAHRIIWKMIHGSEPEVVDHVDGDPSNNRPENLRAATQALNVRNSRRKAGKGLPKGVHATAEGRFRAEITADGARQRLGHFSTPEAAHEAYRSAAIAQHGAFARFD